MAAEKRLANSANNIANIQSTSSVVNGQRVSEPFKPQVVDQLSLEQGGVRTVTRTQDPATIAVFDPENTAAGADGVVEFPNVNLEREVMDQQLATYDFRANLKVLQADDENKQQLLDILA